MSALSWIVFAMACLAGTSFIITLSVLITQWACEGRAWRLFAAVFEISAVCTVGVVGPAALGLALAR